MSTQEIWVVYGIAVALGAIGGILADLLLRGQAGQLEKPRALKRFWDMGFTSEVLIGAGAAAAFLWFLPPGTMSVAGKEVPAYDVRILVGASIVVGTAGGAILAAMAERATALVVKGKAKDALGDAIQEVADLKSSGTLEVTAESQVEVVLERLRRAKAGIDSDPAE